MKPSRPTYWTADSDRNCDTTRSHHGDSRNNLDPRAGKSRCVWPTRRPRHGDGSGSVSPDRASDFDLSSRTDAPPMVPPRWPRSPTRWGGALKA